MYDMYLVTKLYIEQYKYNMHDLKDIIYKQIFLYPFQELRILHLYE